MNTPHDRAPKQRAAHGLSGLATGSPDGLATVFPPCTCRAGEDRPDLRLTSSLAMTDCHRIRPRSGAVCRASHELSPVATGTPSNQAGSPSRRTLRRGDSGPPGAVGVTPRPKDRRPANMPGMTSSGSGGWQSTTRHRGASAPGLGPLVDQHDHQEPTDLLRQWTPYCVAPCGEVGRNSVGGIAVQAVAGVPARLLGI